MSSPSMFGMRVAGLDRWRRVSAWAARPRRLPGRLGSCLAVGTVCIAAVSGCSQSGAGEQPPVPNWSNPIGGRVEASLAAARLHMPFHVRPLRTFSRLGRILESPGGPSISRIVVLQYRTSSGLVDVYEETPQVSLSEFRKVIASWVVLNGQAGTSGTSTAVMLRGRYPALMTTTGDGSRSDIRWIEAGVEYLISGPSLTRQDCLHFASELAS